MNKINKFKVVKILGVVYLVLAVLLIIGGTYSFSFQSLNPPQLDTPRKKNQTTGSPVSLDSPGKQKEKDQNSITFADVGGIQEAKEELKEIVDFLKDPEKYKRLGGRLPRGVLLSGPPGTGKTMIAKAIAGEADRPFIYMSGSEFIEVFVGVGASRVRTLFQQAKEAAPCILFVDEIDSIGSKRSGNMESEEKVQTLNQFLVEMDGFDTDLGIILIAATNRPEILDPALLRSGRFDRRIEIPLPDLNGRADILNIISTKILLESNTDLYKLAQTTAGASGADLSNILNEAALLAARLNKDSVTQLELEEARDKVLFGQKKQNLALTEEDKIAIAYHEAGHTLISHFVPHVDPAESVTIIPRAHSLGHTRFIPKERYSYWKDEIIDHLAVLMGGRAAEETFLGDVSSGASNDMEKATYIARSMILKWGMNDQLGLVVYNSRDQSYSNDTAALIDQEVKKLLDEAYAKAVAILKEKRSYAEAMAKKLIEKETLNAEEIREIIDGNPKKI